MVEHYLEWPTRRPKWSTYPESPSPPAIIRTGAPSADGHMASLHIVENTESRQDPSANGVFKLREAQDFAEAQPDEYDE